MAQYDYMDYGIAYDPEEERKRREEAAKKAGETVVGETTIKKYEDGSQTHTTTQEIPAPAATGFGARLGQAVSQAGTNFVNNVQAAPGNFVNNLNRGFTNLQQAPGNFVSNLQAVNPDEMFKRMQQVESGGRDFTAQGQPLTSPAGAMYKNQVMPATAAAPGFGVAPARDNSPEEYNRVGEQYYQALVKHFGGDTQKAAAAYNAGPGRVQQNIAANQGQLNVGQLPRETQNYLQKVSMPGSGVAGMVAQSQPQTQPAVNPETGETYQQLVPAGAPARPAPVSPYSLATGVNPQGLGTAQQRTAPPAPAVEPTIQAATTYQQAQDNPDALFKLGFDENQPEYIRQRAKDRVIELYDQQKKLAQAQQELPTLTPKQAADAIQGRSRSGVGDWLQYLLFKHVGLNDLANEKAEEMGIGHTWQNATIVDDKGVERSVEVLTSARGKAISGQFTGPNGAPLSQDQLEQAMGGILGKGVHVSKVENVINPATGERIQEQTLSNGKIRYRKGGSAYVGDTSQFQNANAWEKDQDQRSNAANSYLNKNFPAGATPQQQYSAYKQAGVHPRYIETMMGLPEGSLTGEKKPAATTAATTPGVAPGTLPKPTPAKEDIFTPVVQRLGESTADFKAREAAVEAKKKPLIKSVAEPFINKSAGIEQTLSNIRLAIDALDSGEHNIGPLIAGRESSVLPGVQQAVGGLIGTKASENTKLINSFMTEAGLKNIKDTMGPAISNFDVQTKLKQMPAGERSNPSAVREYLLREYSSIYNQAQRAKEITERLNMIEPGTVNLGPPASELTRAKKEQTQPQTGVTSSGNKYKRVQ